MKFEKITTRCGAPLYYLENRHFRTFAFGVVVHVGTRNERWPKEAGLAHFFEHVVFDGNRRFRTSRTVASHIEDVGGEINAETATDSTIYYCLVPDVHFKRAIETLYHMLEEAILEEEAIEREKKIVLEEISSTDDDPEDFLEYKIDQLIFGRHPLGHSVFGLRPSVLSFSKEDLASFRNRFYRPKNYSFVALGNVSIKRVLSELDERFEKRGVRSNETKRPLPAVRPKKKVAVWHRNLHQAHLSLGAEICPANHPDTAALELFETMIYGDLSISSPLFQELRERHGWCYNLSLDRTHWSEGGVFSIYAALSQKKLSEAVNIAISVIEKNRSNSKLFDKARQKRIGQLIVESDEPRKIFRRAIGNIEVGLPLLSLREEVRRLSAVSLKEVTTAVERWLDRERMFAAVIAPKELTVRNIL